MRVGGTYMYDFLVFQQLLPNLQAVPTGFALVLPNGTLAAAAGQQSLGTLALRLRSELVWWQAPVVVP